MPPEDGRASMAAWRVGWSAALTVTGGVESWARRGRDATSERRRKRRIMVKWGAGDCGRGRTLKYR